MRRAQLMGLALAGVLALGAGAPAVALATQGFTGGGMAATVQANEDWHQSGTCLWRITDGLLEVKPANGANGGCGQFLGPPRRIQACAGTPSG